MPIGASEPGWEPQVHQAATLVGPWRRELVAQTNVDGEIGAHLPGIGNEIGLAGGAELADGQASGVLGSGDVAEHVVSEAVTAPRVVDGQHSAGVLVSRLVETVAADLRAEL